MKLKLIKAMLGIIDWISDDIGKEVDKEAFIDRIKCDLLEVEEVHYQEIDIDFYGELGSMRVCVDLECTPTLKVIFESLDNEGIRIDEVIFFSN